MAPRRSSCAPLTPVGQRLNPRVTVSIREAAYRAGDPCIAPYCSVAGQPALCILLYVGWALWARFGAIAALAGSVPAAAQQFAPTPPMPATITEAAALAQDGAAVANHIGVPEDEAAQQLRLQQDSVATTDALATRFAGRLAGIALRHRPSFGIVVGLTGDEPVADASAMIDGAAVPVVFVTGAAARHVELVQAITAYQAAIRASLLIPPGLGVDQRTGELVAVVSTRDVAR